MDDLGAQISYLVLDRGVSVLAPNGQRIGDVEHVLYDEEVDVFDGVIIAMAQPPVGHRFADADQIDEIREHGVLLNVGVDQLHEPTDNPGVLEADPDDVMDSPLHARLRRAWDWLSGNY